MNQEIDIQHKDDVDNILCDLCGNILEGCMCVCPYCGKSEKCECCLYDATTGG